MEESEQTTQPQPQSQPETVESSPDQEKGITEVFEDLKKRIAELEAQAAERDTQLTQYEKTISEDKEAISNLRKLAFHNAQAERAEDMTRRKRVEDAYSHACMQVLSSYKLRNDKKQDAYDMIPRFMPQWPSMRDEE